MLSYPQAKKKCLKLDEIRHFCIFLLLCFFPCLDSFNVIGTLLHGSTTFDIFLTFRIQCNMIFTLHKHTSLNIIVTSLYILIRFHATNSIFKPYIFRMKHT